jgi:hypothetical protein
MSPSVDNPQHKLVFIAHPIRGDVVGNMKKVFTICEQVRKKGHIPIAPYLTLPSHLNDEVIKNREVGVWANLTTFERGYIDELWLYGEKISEGMKIEVALAKKLGIPVVAKSEGTKRDLISDEE